MPKTFKTNGNNGSCPCSNYCAKNWGGEMTKLGWKGAKCSSAQKVDTKTGQKTPFSCYEKSSEPIICECEESTIPFVKTKGPCDADNFNLHQTKGNNGSCSCTNYCRKNWSGEMPTNFKGAKPISAISNGKTVPIDKAPGAPVVCTCQATDDPNYAFVPKNGESCNDPITKVTNGNDGSCSCDNYCEKNWNSELNDMGWIGAKCISAVLDDGTPNKCSDTPGKPIKCKCESSFTPYVATQNKGCNVNTKTLINDLEKTIKKDKEENVKINNDINHLNNSLQDLESKIKREQEQIAGNTKKSEDANNEQNKLLTQLIKQKNILNENRNVLITRNRMLQLSQDRGVYKQKIIYTLISFIGIFIIMFFMGYTMYQNMKKM